MTRGDQLRDHREIGVDVVAPSSAISDDPESFRAGLIRFFQVMGVGIFRVVSVAPG
jgi:hypothetical protein